VFSSEFEQIAAILVLAAVVAGLAKLLRQPVIVAYIVVGVLAGPAVLEIVSDGDDVEALAKIGIAILLFLVGLKLDLHLIKSTGIVALYTGVGQVVFTSLIGYVIIIALGFDPLPALYIAVALTFSSTIIIVKLLSDKRELDQLHGRIAVGFLIVQDLLVIVAMIVIVAIGQPDQTSPLETIIRTVVGGVVFLAAVALAAKFILPRALDWLAKSQELTLLFGVAWAIALAAISGSLGPFGQFARHHDLVLLHRVGCFSHIHVGSAAVGPGFGVVRIRSHWESDHRDDHHGVDGIPKEGFLQGWISSSSDQRVLFDPYCSWLLSRSSE